MILPLKTNNEELIFIEIEETDVDRVLSKESTDIPDGAEYVSNNTKKNKIMDSLKKGIESFSENIYSSLKKANPDEASIEFSIAIKGKFNPIPVIVSSSSESTIKVVLKWKKPTNG